MATYCPYCMSMAHGEGACPSCGRDPAEYCPSVHHLPPGTLLQGRYRIGRVLGEGGFGITYLGLDENLRRLVAVKEYFPTSFVLRENSVSLGVTCYTSQGKEFYERGRDQFLQEARTMARLDRVPQIVHVLDFFPANNTAYLVMEFLEGDTLKELVARQGPIPARELLELMEPVVRGMDTMHRAGVLHRDISPDNLMVLKGEDVKLMDFGCARELEGGHTLTVVLKHGFAPLEQYTGRGQGPWSDVYSLCATLYYCLTGTVPPRSIERGGETDELLPPTQLGAGLTPGQEQALLKGLAVRVKDRWQSAAELYTALYGPAEEDSGFAAQAAGAQGGAVPLRQTKEKREKTDFQAAMGRTVPAQEEDREILSQAEAAFKENAASPSKPHSVEGNRKPEGKEAEKSPYKPRLRSRRVKTALGSAACLAVVLAAAAALGTLPAQDSSGQHYSLGSPSLQEGGAEQQPHQEDPVQTVTPELPQQETPSPDASRTQPETDSSVPESGADAGSQSGTGQAAQNPPAAGVQPEQPASSPEKPPEKEEPSGGSQASQQPAQPQTPQQPVQTAQELYEAGKAANERKDYSTAASLFRQADDKGDADAVYRLADVGYYGYWEDLGDKDTALSLIREAYQRGAAGTEIAPYIRRIGRSFEREEQYDTAAPLLEEAAEMGDLEAMLVLGKLYLYGNGVATSNNTAAYWILKSAQGGNAAAYYDAGVLYQYGWGVEKDWDKARSWYQKALDSDYSTGKTQAQRALDEMDAAQAP